MPAIRHWQAESTGCTPGMFSCPPTPTDGLALARQTINEPRGSTCCGNSIVLIAPKGFPFQNVTIGPASITRETGRRRQEDRDPAIQRGSGRQICKAGAGKKLGAWDAAGAPNSRWPKRAPRRLTLCRSRSGYSGMRLFAIDRNVQVLARRSRSSVHSRRLASAIIYPVSVHDDRKVGSTGDLGLPVLLRNLSRQGPIFEKYGFSFLVSPTT